MLLLSTIAGGNAFAQQRAYTGALGAAGAQGAQDDNARRSPFVAPTNNVPQAAPPVNYGAQRPPVPAIAPSTYTEPPPSMMPSAEMKAMGTEAQTVMELLAIQIDPPTSARVRLHRGQSVQSMTILQGQVLTLGGKQYTVLISGETLADAHVSLLVEDPASKGGKGKGRPKTIVVAEIFMGAAMEIPMGGANGRAGQGGGQAGGNAFGAPNGQQQVHR